MEEFFCTPVRTVPKSNTKKLSLSQNRKKKIISESCASLSSSQPISTPRIPFAKLRPSCLSVEPNLTKICSNGNCDVEANSPVPFVGSDLSESVDPNLATQTCNIPKDEDESNVVPPKIRVRSFALYISPKKPEITLEAVPCEDANDVIVLSSDEEQCPVKTSNVNKCSTSIDQATPKKQVRKKQPSTTTKIEVKRKLTKSTNLKNVTSKYFDASQTRIDNFFTVEKNPKSVGYYETFKKSEIVDFSNHSSKVADYESLLKTEIERMKESASKFYVDVEAGSSKENIDDIVEKSKESYSDITDLGPGQVVRVHADNLHSIKILNNKTHNAVEESDGEVNKENQESASTLVAKNSTDSLNKRNCRLGIAVTETRNRKKKDVHEKPARKRIINSDASSAEMTAITDEHSSWQKDVHDTLSTSDCSDFIQPRPRRACKRLSFTSSSTSMNLRSRGKCGTLESSHSNKISVAKSKSKKPKIAVKAPKSGRLDAGKDFETINESLTERLSVGQDVETIDERVADFNNEKITNIPADQKLYTNDELNASNENVPVSKSRLYEIAEVDLTTLLDTPEQKEMFRTPTSTAPRFQGKIRSTIRKGFGSRTSNKKKRNTRMECPIYKVVEGTKFAVDGFRFGEIEGVTHYFLTHFHADHYIGLKKSFAMPVYLSVISCRLVEKIIGTDKQYLHPVEIEKPFVVDGIEITAIDANHCPGAVMFLFKFPTGLCTLHTGDFRASIFMEEGPVFWNNTVHTIYLDTTYLNSKYDFKPQCESIQDALDVVEQFKLKHIGEKILFVCGSYVIGKEKVWAKIAEENGLKVWSEENRRRAINCIEDERIMTLLVGDPRDANLHILNLGKLNYDYLRQYLDQFHDQFSILLAIRPSGWEKNAKPQYRGRINIVGIEYSEHSSYNELRRFIRFLQPHKIISTVPQSSDISQTVKIPNNWYRNEVRSRRKGYQSSLTNYVKSTKKQVAKPKEPDRANISSNASMSDDIGMLDATEISFKNQQEALCDSDYMS